jgi:hypothetical protein
MACSQTAHKGSFYDKTLNCAKVKGKVQTSHIGLVFRCRGILARQGASLEIPLGEPISLWPLGAAGVQIPLSAPNPKHTLLSLALVLKPAITCLAAIILRKYQQLNTPADV